MEEHMRNLMDVPRARPGLITLISILLGLHGLLLLMLGTLALVAVVTGGRINVFGATVLANAVDVVSVTWLAEGLILLILAWGLWTLKRWAYWTTLTLELLNLLGSGLELLAPQPSLWKSANWVVALSLFFSLVILVIFLISSNIRDAFRA
jgi:hypothetical protein